MKVVFLSHRLNERTPSFGNRVKFVRESASEIGVSGKQSRSEVWQFHNHLGTHIDFPSHFCLEGRSLDFYEAAFFVFTHVGLIDTPLKPSELLSVEHLNQHENTLKDSETDLLLFRTGFEENRLDRKYWEENPGIAPGLHDYLRTRFPKLRAIGFDFISATAFQKRPLGVEAHREFLCHKERPLLFVEDMSLKNLVETPSQVCLAPLLVENADGTPITAMAWI